MAGTKSAALTGARRACNPRGVALSIRCLFTISAWQPIMAAAGAVTSPTTTHSRLLDDDHLHHGLLSGY
jgi:hypothetical protein